jgi:hypothetical protein
MEIKEAPVLLCQNTRKRRKQYIFGGTNSGNNVEYNRRVWVGTPLVRR